MKRAVGFLSFLILMSVLLGCSTSDSGFMSDAKMFTTGTPAANEYPSRSTMVGDNMAMVVRYLPITGQTSERKHFWLQMHRLDGTEMWAFPIDSMYEVGDMIEGEDNTGIILTRVLTDKGVPIGAELLKFDGMTGTILENTPIPWEAEIPAWSIDKLPDNRYLIMGAKLWGRGDTKFIPHNIVIDEQGNKVADWNAEVTNIFPVNDGFIGVMRMPGGRRSDSNLMRLTYDGEVVWKHEQADTLIDGIVMGAVQLDDGDILLTAQNRKSVQPVFVRLGFEDGAVRWIKRPEELSRATCYNPLPWTDGLWFVSYTKMVFHNGQSWNEAGAVLINSDGEIVQSKQLSDIWMVPILIPHDIGPGRCVLVGIGNKEKSTFPGITDVAWLTTGIVN